MDKEQDRNKPKFPLWQYLTQPLFSPEFKSLNPKRFWRLYNADQLEACLVKHILEPQWVSNPVEFLEDCWLKSNTTIELTHDLSLVKFLEGCWGQEFHEFPNLRNAPRQSFDESEEHY